MLVGPEPGLDDLEARRAALQALPQITMAAMARCSGHLPKEKAKGLSLKLAKTGNHVVSTYFPGTRVRQRLCLRSSGAKDPITASKIPAGVVGPNFYPATVILEDGQQGRLHVALGLGLSSLPLKPDNILSFTRGMSKVPNSLLAVSRRRAKRKADEIQFYAADYMHACLVAVLAPLARVLPSDCEGMRPNAACAVVDSIGEVLDGLK